MSQTSVVVPAGAWDARHTNVQGPSRGGGGGDPSVLDANYPPN